MKSGPSEGQLTDQDKMKMSCLHHHVYWGIVPCFRLINQPVNISDELACSIYTHKLSEHMIRLS